MRIALVLFSTLIFFHGSARAEDDDTSAESFQADTVAKIEKAALTGDATEQYHIGVMYLRGKAVEQDSKKAFDWLTKAAVQGYAPAQNRLGTMYSGEYGLSVDKSKAEKWFLKAAQQGNVDAQRNLGNLYGEGMGRNLSAKDVKASFAKAYAWFEKAAAQDDPESQYHLGDLAWSGWDGKPDREQARSWYLTAAKAGYAPAQYALGQLFFEEKAYGSALAWFEKAAEQGWVPALARAALMREEGQGGPRDDAAAWKWWRQAADANDPEAQYQVGYAYRRGLLGQAQNSTEALAWYKKAAAQDERRAALELGLMYQLGEGTPPNDEEGELWIHKAAVLGLAEAQRVLGLMYVDGKGGVSADRVLAVAWLGLATEQGDARARKAFDDYRSQLSDKELGQVVETMKRYRVKAGPH